MNRQKKDSTIRTFNKGYQAGFSGASQDACPHSAIHRKEHWLGGWRQGRSDFFEGVSPFEKERLLQSAFLRTH